MSRTKNYSARITKIVEAAKTISDIASELAKEYDSLSSDSARLNEIQPLLNRLMATTKPETPEDQAAKSPEDKTPKDKTPEDKTPEDKTAKDKNPNPKTRARHIKNKIEELDAKDKSNQPPEKTDTEQSNSISVG